MIPHRTEIKNDPEGVLSLRLLILHRSKSAVYPVGVIGHTPKLVSISMPIVLTPHIATRFPFSKPLPIFMATVLTTNIDMT